MEKTDYDATPLLGSSDLEKHKRENEVKSAAKRRVRVRFQVALVTMLCWLLYVWCLGEAGMMPWGSRLPDGEDDGEDWSSASHFSWEVRTLSNCSWSYSNSVVPWILMRHGGAETMVMHHGRLEKA